MSDIMTCMPFGQLMDWVLQEKKGQDTVFGVHRPYTADGKNDMTIFSRNLETPVGPAAGPHTQLAQNIIASYFAGARFFELKTVQKMDGAELAACVAREEQRLVGHGRILLRASGTEPLIRVMAEADTQDLAESVVKTLVEAVENVQKILKK